MSKRHLAVCSAVFQDKSFLSKKRLQKEKTKKESIYQEHSIQYCTQSIRSLNLLQEEKFQRGIILAPNFRDHGSHLVVHSVQDQDSLFLCVVQVSQLLERFGVRQSSPK